MEVNGVAHVFLTASNFERSREFYRKLLPFLGLKPVTGGTERAAGVALRIRMAGQQRPDGTGGGVGEAGEEHGSDGLPGRRVAGMQVIRGRQP